ncbi:MAG: choice-of-anchor B family protein [Bacteroidota bacterium]
MRPLVLLAAFLLAPLATAQTLELIGTVPMPAIVNDSTEVGGTDVWPYIAPDGSEYAIMGELNGVSIVAVPSLEVVARVPGPTERARSYWRDIKTYGDYAYVVTEAYGPNEGLQVIDLSNLPESAEEVAVVRGPDDALVSSHNLSIDVETGHAYVLNSNGSAIVILSLADPVAPEVVGQLDVGGSHDVFARDGRAYVAEGRQPFISVWDTTDPSSPVLLTKIAIPDAGYVHNVWPNEDDTIMLTTEETADKTVKAWDISDLENPVLLGEWLGANKIAHNVHVAGGYAFLSHYTAGLYVLDISDPANPVEVAHHDTYDRNDDVKMDGNWGATLPSPSGYVYGSDQQGQLTVLRWIPPTDS